MDGGRSSVVVLSLCSVLVELRGHPTCRSTDIRPAAVRQRSPGNAALGETILPFESRRFAGGGEQRV